MFLQFYLTLCSDLAVLQAVYETDEKSSAQLAAGS